MEKTSSSGHDGAISNGNVTDKGPWFRIKLPVLKPIPKRHLLNEKFEMICACALYWLQLFGGCPPKSRCTAERKPASTELRLAGP
jgi:hypothetical protein